MVFFFVFCGLGVLDLLGGYIGQYLGAGRVGKDIVRFLWLGNLSELVFPVWFGGRGLVEELVDISLFSCSCSFSRVYSFGFVVSWVDVGGCGLLPLLYPSIFLSGFLGTASRIRFTAGGETFAFLA